MGNMDNKVKKATKKWEEAQITAATVAENLTKALSVVELYKDELTPLQYADVQFKFDSQKKELEAFLLSERDKYVAAMEKLGLEPLTEEASKEIEVE
jgi:hypothetical protein